MKNDFSLIAGILFLLFFTASNALAEKGATPLVELKQGEAALLKIPFEGSRTVLKGKFLGKTVYFNRLSEGALYGTLIGVDLDEKSAEEAVTDSENNATLAKIQIRPNTFERQEVKVEPKYVNPSLQQLNRVNREKNELHAILSVISEKKEWRGNFVVPVKGVQEGRFGSRRVFNGEMRNPHSGEDIAAPEKTPVVASNDGIVAGVVDHFFSGKGVILDHGQGLFTEYFHLNRSKVKKGQRVKKGTLIGLVGHTGRATGPHLHWGLVMNGARVNPFSLLKVELE
jgi:murein DD-endopeptidase MepM/ murein hydrolase activator NlpD